MCPSPITGMAHDQAESLPSNLSRPLPAKGDHLGSNHMASDQSSPRKHLSKLGHSGYHRDVSYRGTVALLSMKRTFRARHGNVRTIKEQTVMAAKRKSKLRWRSKK